MLLIEQVWKKQPGKFFCVSTKKGKRWKDHWFSKDQFDELSDFIKDNLDKDVYWCPHGFTAKHRDKEHTVPPKLLYADLDGANPKEVALKPTIALESSPGRFVGFWVVDEPIEEQLNRRLSYSIGADVSGWDFSQVLRVPNTKNYKYPSTPRVRILWNDGPTYEVKRLNRVIPRLKNVMNEELDDRAPAIFKKYEKKMPRWVRRELLNGKPQQGVRSEVIWKLQNELIEVGLSRDEVFELIWACPWNKFRERRDGPDQLWRELDKALDQHFSGYRAKDDEDRDPLAFRPLGQSMADVVMRNITWIVPNMYARGEITIVEGDPGLGKSYFQQVVCAALVDQKRIPCEQDYEPVKGRVAYFDTENTADTVTKLRLIENGCENLEDYRQEEHPFSIDDEEKWEKVEEALERFKPDMIVFDTINIYIGSADTYKSSETQQALAHFKLLATRHNCSVVLLRHLTKGGAGSKALYRGQGSIAFTGVARIVITVGLSPDDPSIRVVAGTKNNIGPLMKSFTYRIVGLPDKGDVKNRSKLVWGDFVDLTADDILSVAPIKNTNKDTALKWLTQTLQSGRPTERAKIERMGAARGFKTTDIEQAMEQLGVKKSQRGGREFWEKSSGNEEPNRAESHGSKNRPKSTVRSIRF